MKKSLFCKILILALFLGFCLSFDLLKIKAAKPVECEYTEEYLEWLALDDSEKYDIEMPTRCKISEDNLLLERVLLDSEVDDVFPETYSIVSDYNVVRDQKRSNSCWAYSAISVAESYFAKKSSSVLLSPLHLEYATASNFLNGTNQYAEKWVRNGKVRPLNSGGYFYFAAAYFASSRGPVKYEDFNVPNESDIVPINLEDIDVPVYADVNDVLYVDYFNDCSDASSTIKNHLINYGAVSSTIRYDAVNYLNTDNYAYYYDGDEGVNHAITIVGWDDTYSKNNFGAGKVSAIPENDGAWIVLNSYGKYFGNNGYFYISYEDTKVCNPIGGVRNADTEFTDNKYIYDYTTAYRYYTYNGDSSISYAANTFYLNSEQETLKEIRVGSNKTSLLKAYIIDNDAELNVNNATLIAEGEIVGGGYTTLKLDEPYMINNEKFTIIVEYNSLSLATIPFLANGDNIEGLSYMSLDGVNFQDMSRNGEYASIKAFTDNYVPEYEITSQPDDLDEFKFNNVIGGVINLTYNTVDIKDNEKLQIAILNEDEEDVTNLFTVNINKVLNDEAKLSVIIPKDGKVDAGTYTIVASYSDIEYSLDFEIVLYRNIKVQTTLPDAMYNNETYELTYNVTTTNVSNDETFSVQLEDSTGRLIEVITDSELVIKDNQATVVVKIDNFDPGIYTLKFLLKDNIKATSKFIVNEYIPLELSVDVNSYILSSGDTIQITPIINNATNKEYYYESDNEDVAMVLEGGWITASETGNATIKIISKENPEVYVEVYIKVLDLDISVDIDNVEIISNSTFDRCILYTEIGGKIQFDLITKGLTSYASIRDVDVRVLNSKLQVVSGFDIRFVSEENIDNDSDIVVTSDTDAITISYDNTVVDGTYIIEVIGYYIEDGIEYAKVVDTYQFTITKFIPVTSIEALDVVIEKNGTLAILDYNVVPQNATYMDIDYSSTKPETSGTVITFLNNVLTILPDATCREDCEEEFTITLSAKDGSGVEKVINVSVVEPEPIVIEETDVPRTMFTNTPYTLAYTITTAGIPSDSDINLKITDEEGNEPDTITVELANEKLRVDSIGDGRATVLVNVSKAAVAGTYTLAVSIDEYEVTKTFEIIDYSVLDNITFDEDNYIVVAGNELQLNPTIPSGTSIDQIDWEIVDGEEFATISDDGVITGISGGKVTIKATSKDMPKAEVNEPVLYDFVTNGNISQSGNDITINSGTIKYYDEDTEVGRNVAGTRIGLKIIIPEGLVFEDYQYSRFTVTTNFKEETGKSSLSNHVYYENIKNNDVDNYFGMWPLVDSSVSSIQIDIEWTSFLTQTIIVNISDDVQFEYDYQLAGTYGSNFNSEFVGDLHSPNVYDNYENTVQVRVIDTNVAIGDVTITSDASFDDENLYETKTGTINIPVEYVDIDNTTVDVKVYDKYDLVVSEFIVNKDDTENIIITYDGSVRDGSYYVVIRASYLDGDVVVDNAEDRYDFEVKEFIPITNIDAEDIALYITKNETINYTITPSNATYQELEFVIEEPSILDVVDGVIKPKTIGNTNVTIKALDGSGIEKTINVLVESATINVNIIPDNVPLEIYNSKDIELNFDIKAVPAQDGTSPIVSLSRDGEDIAFDDGLILDVSDVKNDYASLKLVMPKGVTPGTYALNVCVGETNCDEYQFTIKNYIPLGITIDSSYVLLLSDGKLALNYSINPNATSDGVVWTSSDDDIATVSSSGLITFNKAGIVTITGTAIGYPEDYVETIVTIVESSVEFIEDSLETKSNASFSDDLYTYFGGMLSINVDRKLVTDTVVTVLDSNDEVVVNGIDFYTDTLDNGLYNIKIAVNDECISGTYKIKVDGYYELNGEIISETSAVYEFEIKEFVPVSEIVQNTLVMEIGETVFLDSLVKDIVINPEDATYKELDYEFILDCDDCDVNSVSINTVANKKNITAVAPGKVKLKITAKDGYLDAEGKAVSIIVDLLVLEEDIFRGTDYIVKDGYIYLSSEYTTVQGFVDSLNLSSGASAIVTDRNGQSKFGNTGTGDRLHYTGRVNQADYIIILRGDVNGDGRITSADYVAVRNHIMDITTLYNEYLIAADKNEDGEVKSTDYVMIRNIIMEGSSL